MKTYFIIGGAGFIGSHLARTLVTEEINSRIVIYDNFSSGQMWHLENVKDKANVEIIKADVQKLDVLKDAMVGADIVYHFASNPDIAKAATQPDIDFWQGTYLTNNILEAMRTNGVKKILYASGSGVYGDMGSLVVDENYSPCLPISTYGASKLACEALICSYGFMFGISGAAFRFANVVGPNQTHGVGYDFVRRLINNPHKLLILGDGNQSKPYIYVSDVVGAMRLVENNDDTNNFTSFNVSTGDYLTVTEIVDIVVGIVGLKDVEYSFSGGKRGWKGDVPIIRLDTQKLRKLGWQNQYTAKEAVVKSVTSIYEDAQVGRFGWE